MRGRSPPAALIELQCNREQSEDDTGAGRECDTHCFRQVDRPAIVMAFELLHRSENAIATAGSGSRVFFFTRTPSPSTRIKVPVMRLPSVVCAFTRAPSGMAAATSFQAAASTGVCDCAARTSDMLPERIVRMMTSAVVRM